jgi:uncharacterized protein YkwD
MKKNNSKNIAKIIFKNTNSIRRKKKLPYFKYDRGLSYLCRKHSRKMAKKGKIWHGNNVHIAKGFIDTDKRKRSICNRFLYWLLGPGYRGISGENCAIMYKGRVKGFNRKITTDKDIAFALNKIWMNSPGHRANILNRDFKKIGVGIHRRKNQFYATTLFYG